jgi:exodeoxyribonuclease VII large subunit
MQTDQIYSVSSLTRQIKDLLEISFPPLWVEGEVSNFKPHYSGHLYFTLKDSEAQISCVMWRSRAENNTLTLQDGLKVKIYGLIRVYERGGRYQLDAFKIEEAGIGDLQIRFEALKQRLLEEGLFDEKYKKKIPKFPNRIGVITSQTGAAVRDILSVLKRRSPSVEIIFRGVKVQGEGSAQDIAKTIQLFNHYGQVDVLIVGRGGGSLEDLWAFNEEVVARAIFNSKVPIISAVGHEVDFTIADMIADLRAPTPSAAAELAAPADVDLIAYIDTFRYYMKRNIVEKLNRFKKDILIIKSSYAFGRTDDIIRQLSMRIDEIMQRLVLLGKSKLGYLINYTSSLEHRLETLNPANVLNRGYALIYKENKLIASVAAVAVDDHITVHLKDGRLDSIVEGVSHE